MDLQTIFYIVGIVAAVSWLATLVAVGVAAYFAYKKFQELKVQAGDIKRKIESLPKSPLAALALAKHVPWGRVIPVLAPAFAAAPAFKWILGKFSDKRSYRARARYSD